MQLIHKLSFNAPNLQNFDFPFLTEVINFKGDPVHLSFQLY